MSQIENRRSSVALIIIMTLLLIGAIDSYKIYSLDLALWSGQREAPSFCNVSEFVNCDAVSLSEYSTLAGLPNSVYGTGFYTAFLFLIITAIALKSKMEPYFIRLTLIFGFLSSLLSIYLGYISIFVIKAFCILCCVSYFINFSITVLAVLYLKESPLKSIKAFFLESIEILKNILSKDRLLRKRSVLFLIPYFLFCMLLVIIIFAGYNNFMKKTRMDIMPADKIIEGYLKIPVIDETVTPTTKILGSPDASVTIIEFSDFQCPFCKRGAFQLRTLLKQYASDVKLIFKNYPLDNACNAKIERPFHEKACLMSKSAICADNYGKFWDFHDFMYNNAGTLTKKDIFTRAKNDGIDTQEFDSCINSEKTQKIIEEELEDAERFGIAATPTFIINGRKLRGLRPPRFFHEIIKYELSSKK